MAQARVLERNGFAVRRAKDGEQAIELAAGPEPLDLILMDIDLGRGIDGVEAAARILGLRDLPILFLSSHTESEVVERSELVTSYGYVVKNSGETVLLASIRMAGRLWEARKALLERNMDMEAANEELRAALEELDASNRSLVESQRELEERDRRLAESEKKFRTIADFNTDWEYWLDGQGGFVYISPSCESITGYSPGEFIADPGLLQAIVHPDDAELMRKHLVEDICRDDTSAMDFRIVTKAGQVRWLSHRCQAVSDASGAWIGRRGSNRDVTERKRIELAMAEMNRTLKEGEERLSLVIKGADLGTWDCYTPSGRVVFNDRWATMLGYDPAELEPRSSTWEGLIHPDDARAALGAWSDYLEGRAPSYRVECRLRAKDGSWRWTIDTGGVVERHPDGSPARATGIQMDISDLKGAQEEAVRLKKNYEDLFNSVEDFVFILGEDARILHVNASVVERLGYSENELRGRSVLELHPPERREEAARIVADALAGKVDFCPIPLMAKSGAIIPVETRARFGSWDGKTAILGVSKDVSRLTLSEEKFSKLFGLNPSACAMSDFPSGIYVEVNKAFEDLLGYSSAEVVGNSAVGLGIIDAGARDRLLGKADASGKIREEECELRAKDGSMRLATVSTDRIFVQDREYRITVVHDVTARARDEATIRGLLDEKSMLLREVHHRIKNNMSTMASLLSIQAAQSSNPEVASALRSAQQRLSSMEILYDKLYRSENIRELDLGTYLGPLIERAVSIFPGRESVRLELAFEPAPLDARTLSTLGILVNELVTNSMKHAFAGQEGGRITVGARAGNGAVVLSVADDGVGLPASIDAGSSPGLGLGLVDMLSRQLDGSYSIDRRNGTRFTLEFKAGLE